MDRLLSMRVFSRVVEEGGFASAARAMDLSPAAVTRLVSDLEAHLGARLLQRTTRRIALTETGQNYLARVRGILNEIEEAETEAGVDMQEVQGTLRILATPVLASYYLAPVIAGWRERFPRAPIELDIDPFPHGHVDEHDITFLVIEEGVDLGIVARPMLTTEWVVCAAPKYLERFGKPEVPGDLKDHDYLRFPWQQASGPASRALQLRSLRTGECVAVPMPVGLQSSSFDVLYRATLDGAGIAVLSQALIARHLERGTLVRLLPDWIFGRYMICAALPSRRQVPARVRAFLDFLKGGRKVHAPGT
ncbi:LysR family transcriptional regulator [Hydrogenophaga laconesensis]|uniref:DNA-binding transcriptional LysR family regulator n=1 Tax=Hydrogenophaga laconesensis TaxID=1805971 RepID=A0ABU1VIV9_9BURK|nr:LysR family transcriptional regulator [Hydrogenophaga laconesensis]MDR7097421.1 DNA-binding transcriptional LysR family regulator [Hydrogenophaga laconesensis]